MSDNNVRNAVSAECHAMEQALCGMLARVERRCAVPPADAGDAAVNKMMADGLRDAVRLTHAFMDAAAQGYTPLYRARKLVALADGMPRFIGMIRGLEGDRKLSPLFERVLDREYYELHKIARQMRDAVHADSNRLLTLLPEKPRGPDPFAFMATCVVMPFALVCGVVAGVAQGLGAAARERANPPKTVPHLQLVHDR